MVLAPRRMRRDVSRIQSRLIAGGRAVWTGQTWTQAGAARPDTDLARIVRRVQGWFAKESGQPGSDTAEHSGR
jgi:hypothetical protein